MPRHLLAILVALGVVLTGWAVAQEPAEPEEKEEPPLRLIKKKPGNPDGKTEEEPRQRLRDPKEEDPDGKPEDKKPGEEGPPPLPKESEAEVIARIIANMRRSEEKLQKRELDEGIIQTQADVLKDLDSLIALGERQQQQQQNQQQQSNPGSSGEQDQAGSRPRQNPGGSKPQSGSRQAGGNKPMGGNRPSAGGKPQGGSQPGGMRTGGNRPGQSKPGPGRPQPDAMAQAKPQPNPAGGANPGGGGKGETGPRDLTADQYKDVWGHLPESLRAQMNAYSDPRPFMPRYDDLIKRFYQTIAEKGQK